MKTFLLTMLAFAALTKVTPLSAQDKNALPLLGGPNKEARTFKESIGPSLGDLADPNMSLNKPLEHDQLEAGIVLPPPSSLGMAYDHLALFPPTACCAKNATSINSAFSPPTVKELFLLLPTEDNNQ